MTFWSLDNGHTPGNGAYAIGEEPSPYLDNIGWRYLAEVHTSGKPLADFGTWTGRNLRVLTKLASEVVATDVAEASGAVAQARARFPAVRFVQAPLTDLSLPTASVSGGVLWRVLHNLVKPGEFVRALQELHRVLTPGARLVVAVRCEAEHERIDALRVFRRRRPNGADGTRVDLYFTRRSLETVFPLLGFEIQSTAVITEGETIHGRAVQNYYLVAHLARSHRPLAAHSRQRADALIVDAP